MAGRFLGVTVVVLLIVTDWPSSESEQLPTNLSWIRNGDSGLHKYAIAEISHDKPDITGLSVILSIWKPTVEKNDVSIGQIWVENNLQGHDRREVLEVGWMVYPAQFEHSVDPILFTFYTTDNYEQVICYNLNATPPCEFKWPQRRLIQPGKKIGPYSVRGGQQVEVTLAIILFPRENKWWLLLNGDRVGYWPTSVLPALSTGANRLTWGGEVIESPFSRHPTTTWMGSGQFASAGKTQAASIRNVVYYVGGKPMEIKPDQRDLSFYNTHPNLYNTSYVAKDTAFYYGGPGAKPT